ncbi:MAG: HupE/UreJ family protein [Vicinamibacterales bacterium]
MILRLVLLLVTLAASVQPVAAHPAPFSYFDFALSAQGIDVTLVAHTFDLAHDLHVNSPESLIEPRVLEAQKAAMQKLLGSRFRLEAEGRTLACTPSSEVEPLGDRQSIRFRYACPVESPSSFRFGALMFPYDPVHQTFLNVYDQGELVTQAILDAERQQFEYFTGTRQGVIAVIAKFIPAGIHHILIGPDHILFLVGLLLLGGTFKRLLAIVTGFTVAHSMTLSLAALSIVTPPAWLVEPAIALSIVYVGADNLLVRDGGGRDLRAGIAFAFGFIHGFGFASVLRDMGLPARALGWTLFSFNFGVELGQLLIVALVGAALAIVHGRSETAGRLVVVFGSIAVILAGTYWFVQRVFFTGVA